MDACVLHLYLVTYKPITITTNAAYATTKQQIMFNSRNSYTLYIAKGKAHTHTYTHLFTH